MFLYSHQHPWGGERLGGRYTPVERLRRRLRDCLREARLLGDDAGWGRLVSPISTTVSGWARRSKAAASGKAASITTRVSGRWARQQRMHNSRPLSYSFPNLSCRISHLRPSRPSREGFGAALQQRRWGEARSRVIHSRRVCSQFLAGVWKSRLIKPWKSTSVQAKLECCISIGRWNGRLW